MSDEGSVLRVPSDPFLASSLRHGKIVDGELVANPDDISDDEELGENASRMIAELMGATRPSTSTSEGGGGGGEESGGLEIVDSSMFVNLGPDPDPSELPSSETKNSSSPDKSLQRSQVPATRHPSRPLHTFPAQEHAAKVETPLPPATASEGVPSITPPKKKASRFKACLLSETSTDPRSSSSGRGQSSTHLSVTPIEERLNRRSLLVVACLLCVLLRLLSRNQHRSPSRCRRWDGL